MTKLKRLVIFILLFIATSFTTKAQSIDAVQINSYQLQENNDIVQVSIKTSESFIIGANRYVLHIGGKHFLRNIHPDGRLDEIVFLIPLSEYEVLKDQGKIVLVYGFYHENTLQDGEGAQVNGFMGKHWDLGQFTPQELTNK